MKILTYSLSFERHKPKSVIFFIISIDNMSHIKIRNVKNTSWSSRSTACIMLNNWTMWQLSVKYLCLFSRIRDRIGYCDRVQLRTEFPVFTHQCDCIAAEILPDGDFKSSSTQTTLTSSIETWLLWSAGGTQADDRVNRSG